MRGWVVGTKEDLGAQMSLRGKPDKMGNGHEGTLKIQDQKVETPSEEALTPSAFLSDAVWKKSDAVWISHQL
ncbi:hypothetical protein Tco_0332972 [Tanacetum coccineum]